MKVALALALTFAFALAFALAFACNTWNVEAFDFLAQPQLQRGDRFYLRDANDNYVSVCSGCQPINQNLRNQCSSVLCMLREPIRGSVWIYEPHDDGTCSIKSEPTGSYWKRCNNCVQDCPNIICADGVNGALQPAKFDLIKPTRNTNAVAFRTDIGTFLDINQCDQQCGKVVSGVGGLNATFRIQQLPRLTLTLTRANANEGRSGKRWQGYAPISISRVIV